MAGQRLKSVIVQLVWIVTDSGPEFCRVKPGRFAVWLELAYAGEKWNGKAKFDA